MHPRLALARSHAAARRFDKRMAIGLTIAALSALPIFALGVALVGAPASVVPAAEASFIPAPVVPAVIFERVGTKPPLESFVNEGAGLLPRYEDGYTAYDVISPGMVAFFDENGHFADAYWLLPGDVLYDNPHDYQIFHGAGA